MLIVVPFFSFGQKNCQKTFVWNFTMDNRGVTEFSVGIANLFEDALIRYEDCSILRRRNNSEIIKFEEIEDTLQDIYDVPDSVRNKLRPIEAEIVVLGAITDDIIQGDLLLRVCFTKLHTKENILSYTKSFKRVDLKSHDLKKELIYSFVTEMFKEKEKFDIPKVKIIPKKLNQTNTGEAPFNSFFRMEYYHHLAISQLDLFIDSKIVKYVHWDYSNGCEQRDYKGRCEKEIMYNPKNRNFGLNLVTDKKITSFSDVLTLKWNNQIIYKE